MERFDHISFSSHSVVVAVSTLDFGSNEWVLHPDWSYCNSTVSDVAKLLEVLRANGAKPAAESHFTSEETTASAASAGYTVPITCTLLDLHVPEFLTVTIENVMQRKGVELFCVQLCLKVTATYCIRSKLIHSNLFRYGAGNKPLVLLFTFGRFDNMASEISFFVGKFTV